MPGPDAFAAAQDAFARLRDEYEAQQGELERRQRIAEFLRTRVDELERQLAELSRRLPDDLIEAGWHVELRHDYRENGLWHVYYLVAKEDCCAKGQGLTDAEALDQIRKEIRSSE